jgi:DNA primase
MSDYVNMPAEIYNAVHYLNERHIDTKKYEFYWTPEQAYNLHKRVIIPFYWKNEIIGYSARAVEENVKPKYYSQYAHDYVFNTDRQTNEKRFVIVVEGPFDAMAIDGVAILGNDCSEKQADIIDSLGREVIVVPDNDRAGRSLVEQATEYGWSVSFPIWHENCKDISEAVSKYGKLFVLKAIIDGKETSKLKIELKKKKMTL